jgi:Cytochrome c
MKTVPNAFGVIGLLLCCGLASGRETVDAVAEGKGIFESVGCVVCHATTKDDASAKTGPNLYGLFLTKPRQVSIKEESGERKVPADKAYFIRSVRNAWDQLTIAETGPTKGTAYPPAMPSFAPNLISDDDLESVWHYLRTLADPGEAGSQKVMIERKKSAVVKSLLEIPGEVVVAGRPRVARVVVKEASGRAVHVGLPNGMNYTFDPRLLAVRKVWSGGFLNMKAEQSGRAGEPSSLGHQASVILGDSVLPVPLTEKGEPVDFACKEPDVGDEAVAQRNLHDKKDFLDQLSALDAEYLGHRIDTASGMPEFRFRVGRNALTESIVLGADGNLEVSIKGKLIETQRFRVGEGLNGVRVEGGTLRDGVWTLEPSAGETTNRLVAKIAVSAIPRVNLGGEENWNPQPLVVTPSQAGRQPPRLQAGYSMFTWQPPLDLFGRKQLFEATGIAQANDGTIVVSTRTSGIWRIRDGKWSLFAEGIFDSLGVCIEDDHGDRIVISQKPELTRLTDDDGDGRADRFDTLCDDFGFHGNYHEYMHGPVRAADGSYHFNLNLDHNPQSKVSWLGGGGCMGTMGGFRGWSCRVTPSGAFEPFAFGLRSPAGIGVAPDGRLWYAENQGDFVGCSKIVPLEKGGFYGHMAPLVDLPGMTPTSEELKPEHWKDKTRKGAVWLPHGKLANSPGNLVWDLTGGRFGPYAGQMLVGDQTQSNLMRVVTERVNGQDQGCVIPFAWGFSSGVMRPCFLHDGSLLLGQTGRGWGATGGQLDSLQQVVWDGTSLPADILTVKVSASGFDLHFTRPLEPGAAPDAILAKLAVRSWFYLDTPQYGSPEHDPREHKVAGVDISDDRRVLRVALDGFGKDGPWIDRVYDIILNDAPGFFAEGAPWSTLEAYYTVRAIPGSGS